MTRGRSGPGPHRARKSGAHQLCRHPACPPADHQGDGGLVSGAAPGGRATGPERWNIEPVRTGTMEHRAGYVAACGLPGRGCGGLQAGWGLRGSARPGQGRKQAVRHRDPPRIPGTCGTPAPGRGTRQLCRHPAYPKADHRSDHRPVTPPHQDNPGPYHPRTHPRPHHGPRNQQARRRRPARPPPSVPIPPHGTARPVLCWQVAAASARTELLSGPRRRWHRG